jgi:1-pyrroline-5-carboxylate dehydrogenase
MSTGIFTLPTPYNEPVRDYAPGSPERASLKQRLSELDGQQIEIPMIIGGEEVRTGTTAKSVKPHAKHHVLAEYHKGGAEQVEQAIAAARDAHKEWSRTSWDERAAVFLRAADLLTGPWRDTINAATMLGQSKTVYQAEIDAACELADFWRFNPTYMRRIMEEQPRSSPGIWNRMEYRPLEGFVFAVAPFNFTAIAGNLSGAPALMGNTVILKPASTAVYSTYFLMKLLEQAGLPPGVINMVLGSGAEIGDAALRSPELAGIHFTGSTAVFQSMWKTVGDNIAGYHGYPRIVGETGGKDFILAHTSADPQAVATAILRGGFEYQGQKCSAASRVYAPSNLWPQIREALETEVPTIRMGPVEDFRNFMGAVIDQSAYTTQADAFDMVKKSDDAEIVVGGDADDSDGYFVGPTVIATKDPSFDLMQRELFGPVVTTYVYDEKRFDDTLDVVNATSPYALTGAVFATDRSAISHAHEALRDAAGNFYVNDKPTGAVVGQQPFGGARASGTNDKAGSMWNLIRWTSPRTIKETFVPAADYRYPFMAEE